MREKVLLGAYFGGMRAVAQASITAVRAFAQQVIVTAPAWHAKRDETACCIVRTM